MTVLSEYLKLLLAQPSLLVLLVTVLAVFLGAFLWKILHSKEGFLIGYGDWVVGKWQAGSDSVQQPRSRKPKSSHGAVQGLQRTCRPSAPELQTKEHLLKLSRLLDSDLAYLMTSDASEWEPKIFRAMQTIVSSAARVVCPAGHCRCGFFVPADDERHLVLVAGEGYAGSWGVYLVIDHSCAGRAFLTGEDYYCRDINTDPIYWQSSRGNRDYRSIACVPVRAGHKLIGVICLDAPEADCFTADDFAYLGIFATKLAIFSAFHGLRRGATDGRFKFMSKR